MNVEDLVNKYKKLRTFAKWKPFILNAAYIIGLSLYVLKLDEVKNLAEILFFTTPINSAILLRESYLIGLCKYHKIACLLPTFNFCTVFIHRYIYCLKFYESYYNHTLIFISIILIMCGYYVFAGNKINLSAFFRPLLTQLRGFGLRKKL